MIILRLFLVLVVLLMVSSGGMYIFTRNRRYLTFAWQTLRFTIFVLLILGLLFILERFVLSGWRVML